MTDAERLVTGDADAPEPHGFDREAVERILRRAVRLSERVGPDDGISERALVEAADELGIDPAMVRRATGEERLGLLDAGPNRVDRMVGPGVVCESRVVDGTPDEVMAHVDEWLRRAGSLRRRRLGAGTAEYSRRSDVAASVQRGMRSLLGEEDLGEVRRLRVAVHGADHERTVVVLAADLRSERSLTLLGGGSVAAVGSTASVSAVLATSVELWLLGVPASLAAGAGILLVRAHAVRDVRLALAGALDRIAAGEDATRMLSDVGRRLLGRTRVGPSDG